MCLISLLSIAYQGAPEFGCRSCSMGQTRPHEKRSGHCGPPPLPMGAHSMPLSDIPTGAEKARGDTHNVAGIEAARISLTKVSSRGLVSQRILLDPRAGGRGSGLYTQSAEEEIQVHVEFLQSARGEWAEAEQDILTICTPYRCKVSKVAGRALVPVLHSHVNHRESMEGMATETAETGTFAAAQRHR